MIDINTSFIFQLKKIYFSTNVLVRVIISGFLVYIFLFSPNLISIVFDFNEMYFKNLVFIIVCEIVAAIIIMVPWFFIKMYSFKKMRIINFLIYVFLFSFVGLMLFSLYAVAAMTFDSPGSEDVFSNWIFFIVFTGVPTIIFLGGIINVFFQERVSVSTDHNVRDILNNGFASFLHELSRILRFDIIRSRMTKKIVVITLTIISLIAVITCIAIGRMLAEKERREIMMRSVSSFDDTNINMKSDWRIFNSTLGFSFEYPKDLLCSEQKDLSDVIPIGCMDIKRNNEYIADPASYYHYKNNSDICFVGSFA